MARVLRKKLSQNIEKSLWIKLLKEVKNINSVESLKGFLDKFFTADEKILILRRLAVMELIENRRKYRDIKNILDVSSATISAVKDIFEGRGYNKKSSKKESQATLKSRNLKKNKRSKFPAHRFIPGAGKGRWGFLNQT